VFRQHSEAASCVGIFVVMVAVVFGIPATVAAQPSGYVTLGGMLDSFRPVTTSSESRQNLAGAVDLEHVFADERGRVFYSLDAGNYDSPGDWSFYLHDTSYRFGGSDPGDRKLFLTGSFVVRQNGEAWTSAAYKAVGGGLNTELHPRDNMTFRAGYRGDYRRFDDLSALTQFEQRGFASLLSNFQTRTTIIAEAQVGMKHYDGVTYMEVAPRVTVDTGTPQAGSQGQGMGMGSGNRVPAVPTYLSSNQEGAAGLVSVMGRVAQSLADRTGVHAQATLRRTLGSVPPLLVTTPAGFFEDGVYDDPFASDGLFLQAGMKHVFTSAAELTATGWWADKQYTSAVALDDAGMEVSGSPLRADTVTLGTVAWKQPLLSTKTGAVALSAEVGYRFIRHRSNDTFYNYTSHAIGVGFTVGY
jgi:hypothetical protein